MKDYIDREAAIESLCCDCSATRDCRPGERCVDYQRLKAIPAADVVERKKGEWVPVTNGRGGSECNLCHVYAPSYKSGREYRSNFCPNCGAEMREEAKE